MYCLQYPKILHLPVSSYVYWGKKVFGLPLTVQTVQLEAQRGLSFSSQMHFKCERQKVKINIWTIKRYFILVM